MQSSCNLGAGGRIQGEALGSLLVNQRRYKKPFKVAYNKKKRKDKFDV